MLFTLVKSCFLGLLDSLRAFPLAFSVLLRSRTLQVLFTKCLVLNGVLFIGSLVAWEHLIRPALDRLLEVSISDQALLYLAATFSTVMYYILWIWPLYMLSFLLSSLWYQDIARHMAKHSIKSTRKPSSSKLGISTIMGKEMYRTLLFTVYLIQTSLLHYVHPYLSLMFLSWLYSFYSFEYVWISQGWSLERKCIFFEERWPYFLGFGLPCAMITFLFPQMLGTGLFALVFPIFEISSFSIVPFPVNNSDCIRLPIFFISNKLVSHIVQRAKTG